MLQITNLTSNRQFKIRNFDEDKIATLNAHPGLRYEGKTDGYYKFSGNYYLLDNIGELIESFEIAILVHKSYPNTFPIIALLDDKIDRLDEFHVNELGIVCIEHTYIANKLANEGLRIYDFVNYYLHKYFSWALVKKSGVAVLLQEWAHHDEGTIQVYETLFEISDKIQIASFLNNYLAVHKIGRNDKCYCGCGKKLKYCHYDAALFLKNIPRKEIEKDIALFK